MNGSGVEVVAVTKFSGFNMRQRFLAISMLSILVISLIFSIALREIQTREYMKGVDEKLVTGAMMARSLLGESYHDGLVNRSSVGEAEYLSMIDRYNQICLELGFQYLWSNLFLDDGSIVFTSSASASKDVTQGDHALFFDSHSDPAAFEPVMATGATTFSTFHNEWGDGRMVLIPFKDVQGRVYVFGASISINELQSRLARTTMLSVMTFLIAMAVAAAASMAIAAAITRPLDRVNAITREIAAGNYGLHIDNPGGGEELFNLATAVNAMSDAIMENHRSLEVLVRELEEAQDELRRSRDNLEVQVAQRTHGLRKLTQAVEQSPYGVLITDLDGIIEYVNRGFTDMTGFSTNEAIGKTPRIIQAGDTPVNFYEELWSALKTDGQWAGEIRDRRKDGQVFWAFMTVSTINDDYGNPINFVAVHEDITERKLAEQSIRLAKDEAEAANRAKSEMLANMSHELRTPLNAIIGFSDTILQEILGPVDNKKYQEYIGDINRSGIHLLSLINDILDVSAVEAGKLRLIEEEVDLGDILGSCIRLITQRAEAGRVQVNAIDGVTGLRLIADGRRLKQALLNLISNAVKFTPEDGQVTIKVERKVQGEVAVHVIDTGVGMSEEGLLCAMEKFGQADSGLNRRFEGTGLGLPLTKGLVELHAGELTLKSAPGVGTTATIVLPKERVVLD